MTVLCEPFCMSRKDVCSASWLRRELGGNHQYGMLPAFFACCLLHPVPLLHRLRTYGLSAVGTIIKNTPFKSLCTRNYMGSPMNNIFAGKKVLVTGGAGSIGSAIVHELVTRDCTLVRVLDMNETGLFTLQQELA